MTRLTFGTRSTTTGPQAYGLRCDLNGYAETWANGTLSANSTWGLAMRHAVQSSVVGQPVTFRIYGYGGSGGGSSNWRIDDLTVWASAIDPDTPSPPVIFAVEPQSVRLEETLSFALSLAATDGDPITATNAAAETSMLGVWSLTDGVFRYSPAASDIGERAFVFTASDKDGTSLPVRVAVKVCKPLVSAVRLTGTDGAYSQTFDALATNGTNIAWDNAADPLEAWYAFANTEAVTTYRSGTGSGTSSGLQSFGTTATNTDRSLGSLSGNEITYHYGVAFTNDTGLTITNLLVGFTAEQWRAASAATSTLMFAYCVTSAVLPLTSGFWHPVHALCFDSPVVTNAEQVSGPVYQARELSAAILRPVLPGCVVMLRWSDNDDPGNDHAFGIDDVNVAWSAGPYACAIGVPLQGVHECFNEMGTDAPAELPSCWRVETRDGTARVSGAYADASETVSCANTSGAPSGTGSCAFSAGCAFDQAVGAMLASNIAGTVTVSARFMNALDTPLRTWDVRYALEKYRNGTIGSAVRLLASTDGVTWREIDEPSAFAADADDLASDVRPGVTITVMRKVTFDQAIAAGDVFYLAWQFAAADESVADASYQAWALDDVDVVPAPIRRNLLMIK